MKRNKAMANNPKPIVWTEKAMPIGSLKPAKYNPRKISEKQVADLRKSVEQFGRVEPVVVNSDGTIIGGHQRVAIYGQMGVKEVSTVVPSRKLTEAEERELNLRLNKNAGEWDWQLLKAFSKDVLMEVGFDEAELRVNMGISDAGEVDVDVDRMDVLTVLPPESPRLKERAQVHCDTVAQYEALKALVDGGEITAERLISAFSPQK